MQTKRHLLAASLLTIALGATAQMPVYQNLPDGDPYPGYNHNMQPDPSLGVPRKLTGPLRAATQLPDHWDNASQKYFPPIFSQGGYGSCGVSSHVGYMLTSEMNAFNNTDASLLENQLTPMFEYPFTYHGPGKDEMALYVGYPTADIYGGRYVSSIYGGSESNAGDWGWVQGYDIFYNAMKHRITHAANFPQSVETEEGRAAVKRYLYNHNDDPAFGGRGGIVCIGVGISSSARANIPQTSVNDAIGATNKAYILHWNLGGSDHAMTICGYDDRIQFDLDANGVAGEENNTLGQNENGAWIIANTWGTWGNDGFIYCPYAMGGGVSEEVTTPGGKTAYKPKWFWSPYVYYYRTAYTPKRTMKVTMQYDHRSEISVVAGVASNPQATKPEKTFQFSYINYTGDGTGTDPATPMLGKWADGTMHEEPMEFGIDLTDLTDGFDSRQPLKYFLVVNSKSSAVGEGKILSASVIDYEFNPEGVETPFADTDVEIKNKGKQTVISTMVSGEALNAPLNARIEGGVLQWMAPQATAYTPAKYYVYKNGNQQYETTATSQALGSTDGSWTVKAAYVLGGKEYLSNASNTATAMSAMTTEQAFDNNVITLNNGSFYIPNVASGSHQQFTIEYWFKPSNLHNWGDFLFNGNWNAGSFTVLTSSSGDIQAGWNYNDCVTASGVLKNNRWNHVAIVINGNKTTVYVNGVSKGSKTSSSYSGFAAFPGGLYFGAGNNALNGQLDELRLWDTALTAKEIKANYQTPVINPSMHGDLLTYLKMDTYDNGGTTYIKDWANGNDAVVVKNVKAATLSTEATIKQSAETTAECTVSMPATASLGEAVTAKSVSPVATATCHWTAEGATPATSDIASPTFVFNTVGEHKVTLTVTDINDATATGEATVNVQSVAPTADFDLTAESVKGGDRISFVSKNQAVGCRYNWQMPGADVETATTVNASATYSSVGTKTVTLTVTDPQGQTYTQSKTFQVELSAPGIGYAISPNVVMKGQPVTLTDRSSYSPTFAQWNLLSSNAYISSPYLQAWVTPQEAGTYDLTYTVANEVGTTTKTIQKALIVCNTESKTGLNFYSGTQSMTANVPAGIARQWTLDFWLKPTALVSPSVGITAHGTAGDLVINSDNNGASTVTVGGNKYEFGNLYVADEWHHYAFIASGTTITAYRDGVKVNAVTTGISDYSGYFATLTFGGANGTLQGVIDEMHLWAKNLTQTALHTYSEAPLEDVSKAKSSNKLLIYYNFDQTLADAEDMSGNGATGVLSGFENTVDYYTPTDGVFCLSFAKAKNETIDGTLIPQSKFTVTATSDEETVGETAPGSNVLDGDKATFWHSQWKESEPGFPHSITFKREGTDTIRTIQFAYASDQWHKDYRSDNITVEESEDGTNWTMLDTRHSLFNFATQNLVLVRPATAPYVRVTFNSSVSGKNMLCVTEVNFYGGKFSTGIDGVTVSDDKANASGKVYDLQGRRVVAPLKSGVYIVDGKKVVVK